MSRGSGAAASITLQGHLNELRVRLTWVVLAIVLASAVAYLNIAHITAILQSPINQTLYYVTPGGGFSFVLKLSIVTGIILALPVVMYHIFAFVAPLVENRKTGFAAISAFWSLVLAYCGAAFAYFITLPAALHFLVQFGGENIQSLIGVNEYFNFVMTYVLGFSLLFQIPLLILFFDRVSPLNPGAMMKYQRYLIVGCFIVAALFTPTPDPVNQAFMALPMILLYQVGAIFIWRRRRKEHLRLVKAQAAEAKKAELEEAQRIADAQRKASEKPPVSDPALVSRPAIRRPARYSDIRPPSKTS